MCVGVAVLAGIAASDAICTAALGRRSSGQDHQGAADLLAQVDATLGSRLRSLVKRKGESHYGDSILTPTQRVQARRDAEALVKEARLRQP